MKRAFDEISFVVDEVIESFSKSPIDLLGINDVEGEKKYLNDLRDSYVRTILNIVRQKPPIQSGSKVKVLEIGAFLGVVSICLAKLGYAVAIVDIPEFISNQRLQSVFKENHIEYYPCNLRSYSLQFKDSSFDCVIMCEVLEHLNFNPLPIIQEINRVMQLGGLFYLSLPNIVSLKKRIRLLFGKSIHNPINDYFRQLSQSENMIIGLHWREYAAYEIEEMLRGLGFQVKQRIYFSEVDYKSFSSLKTGILKLIYTFMPILKDNQTTMALKQENSCCEFYFTDATRP